ncbi:hypothetical protein D9753_27630 [Streptomyces dangxiongensis]|uniref:Uncharacterized protein n=1 Tax=Streptomyces dangxiongensis TaxID=1442032 RepID=A0A3G2JHY4_9ACTN|nr:hypothetical protein D9753_27630 [Streptomyces dangxiongensis]
MSHGISTSSGYGTAPRHGWCSGRYMTGGAGRSYLPRPVSGRARRDAARKPRTRASPRACARGTEPA